MIVGDRFIGDLAAGGRPRARRPARPTFSAALEALREADGWKARRPTANQVKAHGAAHTFRPDEEMEPGDADDGVNGLWAAQDAGGITVVELGVARGQILVWPVGADAFRGESTMDDLRRYEKGLRWLPLTVKGEPTVVVVPRKGRR